MSECTDPSRRRFLEAASVMLLAVQCWPGFAQANADVPSTRGFVIRSSPGFFFHTHEIVVPYAALRTPPANGIRVVSTESLFHAHELTLQRPELVTIASGGSVTRRASSHLFVIARAAAFGRSAAPQSMERSI